MSKTALIVIYTHNFEKNIEKINKHINFADRVLSALSDEEKEQFFSHLYKIRDKIVTELEDKA